MDKDLAVLAKQILDNKNLKEQIKTYLPKLRDSLNQTLKRSLDREKQIGVKSFDKGINIVKGNF